jgi:ferredoxin-nitrate reductase
VHLSEQAVAPPGEARSDHDVFLDYAARMGFTDRDGAPLIKWTDPEGAFDDFKRLTAGRPCDHSAMTYALLRAASGIQWPCTTSHPAGTDRLYVDHVFPSDPEHCEEYGHDLASGAANDAAEYRALQPAGRAFLKAARWTPPHEEPDRDYPFTVTTGRTVYHWHTRTKTGRARELQDAAPDVWVEMSPEDAHTAGLTEGAAVRVESRRGALEGTVRITDIRPGAVFVPFHYGYWDAPDRRHRAANELTLTAWDPISHQPYFKHAAVRVVPLGEG